MKDTEESGVGIQGELIESKRQGGRFEGPAKQIV